ncbi:MAG: biopolymer transporter ExbD [Planctomycetales bacterium]|nr:biopolymer transporter ExbD [Planctomycetales bacterium]
MDTISKNLPSEHGGSDRLRTRDREDELDLTPMVDVTFLLLIFFMITAAFALQKSIEVPPVGDEVAAAQTVEDLEQDSVVIRIDGDNVYWIGAPVWEAEQKVLSKQDLLVKLREARGGGDSGTARLLVQANGDSRHEYVVAALDAGSGVGMEEIRLMNYEDGDLDL